MKKIMFFIISFCIVVPNVKANCSDDEAIRLSKLANNVTISYMFNEETRRFDVTFTNVTKELIIINSNNDKRYNEDIEFTIKNLLSGNYKFNIKAKDTSCNLGVLKMNFINLPYYNKYHYREECKNIQEYSYCSKWISTPNSDEIFEQKINEYRKSLIKETIVEKKESSFFEKIKKTIQEIYVNYYYIILPLIITILCIIIYLKDKSEQLI